MTRFRIPSRSAEQHVAAAEDMIREGIDRLGRAHVAALDEQASRQQTIQSLSQVIAQHQERNTELDDVRVSIGRRLGNLRSILGD